MIAITKVQKKIKTICTRLNKAIKIKQCILYGVQLRPQAVIFTYVFHMSSRACGLIGLFFLLKYGSKVVPLHAIKACGQRRYDSSSFLTSVLNGGELSDSCIFRLFPEQDTNTPTDRSLSLPHRRAAGFPERTYFFTLSLTCPERVLVIMPGRNIRYSTCKDGLQGHGWYKIQCLHAVDNSFSSFWALTQCCFAGRFQNLQENYRPHIQGISEELEVEDGGRKFVQNTGIRREDQAMSQLGIRHCQVRTMWLYAAWQENSRVYVQCRKYMAIVLHACSQNFRYISEFLTFCTRIKYIILSCLFPQIISSFLLS